MKLSNEARLIVAMLASVQRRLGIMEEHDEVDPDFVMGAIYAEQQWAIAARYPGLFSPEALPPVVSTVQEHLSMWTALERCYAELPPVEQERVAAAVGPSRTPVRFPGYDAQHERDYLAVTRFTVEYMQMHMELADRADYIAGQQMLPRYEAMIARYRQEKASADADSLAPEQLIRVLQAAE